MNSNEFFFRLTPDRILSTLEDAGFHLTGHIMTLNSYENRVFDLKQDDGSHVVAKFYRPGRWSREEIAAEHQFIDDLARDEIPVCAPMALPEGDTIGESAGIFFAVWPRTGGRMPDEFSDDELAMLGRLLARIHNNGAAKEEKRRPELTSRRYALEPLEYLLARDFLPAHLRERYAEMVREVAAIYDERVAGIPFHRIHGDCHLGNLLKGRDGWFFLDFDDFLAGPAVQDLWMLVPARDTEGRRQREVFLEGYRTFRDFDESWLRLVEPLRALRFIYHSYWIAKRWDDPAFPAAFPHFGTEAYWEDETADLADQLDVMLHEKGNSAQPTEQEELSNKDFFWDWEE